MKVSVLQMAKHATEEKENADELPPEKAATGERSCS